MRIPPIRIAPVNTSTKAIISRQGRFIYAVDVYVCGECFDTYEVIGYRWARSVARRKLAKAIRQREWARERTIITKDDL